MIATGLIAWWLFPSELMARWRRTAHPSGQVANLVGGTASGVALLSVASFALALVCIGFLVGMILMFVFGSIKDSLFGGGNT